jgi:NADPH-dependent 2,4-dienoyl-CoA reductase/sulfur reductase-like enzyme
VPDDVSVWYADDQEEPPPSKRVVVLGVGRAALVAAERLAERGAQVTMLAGDRRPGWDVAPTFKWRHAAWIHEFEIRVLRGARAEGWDDAGRLRLAWEAEAKRPEDAGPLELDLLVLGEDRHSRQELVRELEYRVDVLHVIGDAVHPASIGQAVHSAYRTALGV